MIKIFVQDKVHSQSVVGHFDPCGILISLIRLKSAQRINIERDCVNRSFHDPRSDEFTSARSDIPRREEHFSSNLFFLVMCLAQ